MNTGKLPTGIRLRGDAVEISYQANGQRRFETLDSIKPTATGISKAVKIRKQRIEALKFGTDDDADLAEDLKSGTFASVAQAFLDDLQLKASTRQSYKQLLQDYWMPRLQHRNIWAIELPLLRKIHRETEWSSRKVEKNAVSALRQVFVFAAEDGYRDDNPAQKLIIKRERGVSRTRKLPDSYTVEERDTLLDWLKSNTAGCIHAYFLTAFHTGMRSGELIALDWPCVDLERGYLRVNKARVRREITTTKTDEDRDVIIPDHVSKVLAALPSRFAAKEVFTNQYGRHYEQAYHLNKRFREAHKATGVRHRDGPYPWRHTYASLGLTGGANPAWLAKQLGHSKQMFFEVYAEVINDQNIDQQELAKLL